MEVARARGFATSGQGRVGVPWHVPAGDHDVGRAAGSRRPRRRPRTSAECNPRCRAPGRSPIPCLRRPASQEPRGIRGGGPAGLRRPAGLDPRRSDRVPPGPGRRRLRLVDCDPERVAALGSACDRTWSCRNGRNVVVNEARWLSGSPSGVLAGDLPSYKAMVLNHETGHWLGLSHRLCPRAGDTAPLMQRSRSRCRAAAPPPGRRRRNGPRWRPGTPERPADLAGSARRAARRRRPAIDGGCRRGDPAAPTRGDHHRPDLGPRHRHPRPPSTTPTSRRRCLTWARGASSWRSGRALCGIETR